MGCHTSVPVEAAPQQRCIPKKPLPVEDAECVCINPFSAAIAPATAAYADALSPWAADDTAPSTDGSATDDGEADPALVLFGFLDSENHGRSVAEDDDHHKLPPRPRGRTRSEGVLRYSPLRRTSAGSSNGGKGEVATGPSA